MYTIKEVADKLGISASTIRFYDKEGLLPFIHRSASGYRLFSKKDLEFMEMIECLKKTKMSIKDIKNFTKWVRQGDDSLQERYDMFLERKKAVELQIEELKKTLEVVDYKCWYYETALKAGTEAIHYDYECEGCPYYECEDCPYDDEENKEA